jgi:hypothetical protein
MFAEKSFQPSPFNLTATSFGSRVPVVYPGGKFISLIGTLKVAK